MYNYIQDVVVQWLMHALAVVNALYDSDILTGPCIDVCMWNWCCIVYIAVLVEFDTLDSNA